jgi:serine/threonine protein phosphatase 1
MRTLAIGDVHGCAAALDALLARAAPKAEDLIVTLGDYVDRGPDSAGVMNRLVRLSKGGRLVALRGNHEEMMMDARETPGQLELWRSCGGDAALRSYAVLDDEGNLADVPDEHWDFLDHFCRDYYETKTHIFVHAGVYADLPMAEQPGLILRWEFFNDPPAHESGKVVVCGHTTQPEGRPRNIGHAVCIDPGAHKRGGWLTCLEAESGRLYQASQKGETRESWVDEYLVE